jgi:chitinase
MVPPAISFARPHARTRPTLYTLCFGDNLMTKRIPGFSLSLLILFLSFHSTPAQAQKPADNHVFGGYFEEWDVRYSGYTMATLEKTGVAAKLTHLIYAFGNVTPGPSPACAIDDPHAAWQDASILAINGKPYSGSVHGNFAGILELKALHPQLKTLISLGGQAGDVSGFTLSAASPTARRALAASCINLFVKGHLAPGVEAPGLFDGFNIDWEFPLAADRENFTALLHEFRTQLDELGRSTGRHYILTFDSPANPQRYANIDLKAAAAEVDFLTIDGYDYAAPDEKTTNASSALYNSPADPLHDKARAIDDTVQAYLKAGVPAAKYTMGLPLYGIGWSGVSDQNHGLYQSAAREAPVFLSNGRAPCPTQSKQAPSPGCDTILTPGFATDRTLTQLLRRPDARFWYDPARQGATLYLTTSRTFYTFDNLRSIAAKTAYIHQHKLRGAYVWALNDDDTQATVTNAIAAGLE